MSEARLAPGALRLCGIVCCELGWRPADFWETTPAEIAAVMAGDQPEAGPGITRDHLQSMMEQERDG